jgi:hypothetical protein
MSLKVETFTGGISGNEDADRMLVRCGIKGEFDRLAFLIGSGAVKDGDSFVGPVGSLKSGLKLLVQVALCIVVLGENDDSNVIPLGWRG